MLDLKRSVADLVLEHSECAPIFERHRIDFCCRGNVSILEAGRAAGVQLDTLERELLLAIESRSGPPGESLRELETRELLEHIIRAHHGYLRTTLPFAAHLASKVSRVHGSRNPKLRDLEVAVVSLAEALTEHINEEEAALFPELVSETPNREKIDEAFSAMRAEHLGVSSMLESIRSRADEFVPPDWACNSYRTLLSELEKLERDTHAHVHLENHLLAPRFVVVTSHDTPRE
ncbi:MAG: DUF542 domain-containing protein [Deltaproteobacteria bacterium]|nr:DUF542 domain-containing protein [Deltaproteobacteria bacterium]